MPNKKLVPFLVFLLSISISSCIINDKSLGQQFVSNDYILKVDTVAFDLPLTVKNLDSIQGYSTSYMLLGSICDPTFGPMHSNTASFIRPYSDSTYFGIEPELISVYVNLFIDSTVIYRPDQEGIPQNFKVYEMLSDLDSSKLYNNSIKPSDYSAEPISIGSPVFFGDDSVRVHLNKEFGKKLLSCTVEEFDSLALFVKKIKGFYITSEAPGAEEGGRLNYLALGSSTLYLNYYLTDPQRNYSHHDTTEAFAFGYNYSVNSISTSSEHLATDTPAEQLYVESMSGVKPHLNGAALKSILNRWMEENNFTKETVLISRAELILPYETDPEDYVVVANQFPKAIYPCFKYASQDSTKYLTPLAEIYSSASIGSITRALKQYSCDITKYTQSIILKDDDAITSTDDLYLSPIYSYSDSSNNIYYAFDNINYQKAILNGPGADRKPTLKLTYAVLNY